MAKADNTRFATDSRNRDQLSREKDAVTLPIVRSIRFENPHTAQVLLMPNLQDPVVDILTEEKGVLRKNIRACERDRQTWQKMVDGRFRRVRDLRLPPKPRPVSRDIEYVCDELKGRKLDLVYLDFFGQPTDEVYEVVRKLFHYDMLARKAVVLITTLLTRSRAEQSDFNTDVRVEISGAVPHSTQAKDAFKLVMAQYIKAAAHAARHLQPSVLVPHVYWSLERKTGMKRMCVLTEARWQ